MRSRTRVRVAVGRFRADERAVEGLPVRLVVALVVGVACLSVMLNMVEGVGTLAVSEVDVRPEPAVLTPGPQDLAVTVVDADGDPVAGATVVLKAGTADLDGVATAETDADGVATLSVDPELAPNQDEGTLVVDVMPPPASEYADRRGNTRVLVVAEAG